MIYIIIDSKLSFNPNINLIKTTNLKGIHFTKKLSKHNLYIFIWLYYVFVYPVLTYCWVVWRSHLNFQIELLESVNDTFLRYVSYRINKPMRFNDH